MNRDEQRKLKEKIESAWYVAKDLSQRFPRLERTAKFKKIKENIDDLEWRLRNAMADTKWNS